MNTAPAGIGILREFNPVSWFHARGIYRVLSRLKPRLPNVAGMLFLTFTINPALYADPSAAFEDGRARLRRIFHRLRRGVVWNGVRYVLDAPYAVKVEFHRNGWAHFHVIFLSRRFLPGGLLNELWALGRTNVRRISNRKFHYLLKYVTKGGGLPEWVLSRSRLRVFQASRGFYADASREEVVPPGEKKFLRKPYSSTIGERIERWRRTALIESSDRFQQIVLCAPFFELLARFVLPVAEGGRYLGGGRIQINDITQLLAWIT